MSSTLSTFAQGTVVFNNRVTGLLITHVYAGGTQIIIGNASDDTPTGSTSYAGLSLVGANGTGGFFGAGTTFAQLLAAPGSNAPESSLVPANNVTTFRTGAAAGNVVGITSTLVGVPVDAPSATIEMVVWDNSSGLYPNWTQASPAVLSGLIAAGRSNPFVVSNIGGGVNSAPNLIGLQSFNIYFIPEPATSALALLGLVGMVCFHRKTKP